MKPAAAFLLLTCLLTTCVEINGGAVEVSWVIRSRAGSAITDCGCASPSIATVRLRLVRVGGALAGDTPCANQAQCDFPCPRQTGSTPFNIPETQGTEKYEVSVVAVGARRQPAARSFDAGTDLAGSGPRSAHRGRIDAAGRELCDRVPDE